MGGSRVCILRNHGLLTGGRSPGEAVGWFVAAERVAEVHVKAPDAKAISEEAAKEVEASLFSADNGWRNVPMAGPRPGARSLGGAGLRVNRLPLRDRSGRKAVSSASRAAC